MIVDIVAIITGAERTDYKQCYTHKGGKTEKVDLHDFLDLICILFDLYCVILAQYFLISLRTLRTLRVPIIPKRLPSHPLSNVCQASDNGARFRIAC